MLLSAYGTQSQTFTGLLHLLAEIAQETIGPFTLINARDVKQLREQWSTLSREQRTSVLISSDAIGDDLKDLLISSGVRCLVYLESFEPIALFHERNCGDLNKAIQLATQSVSQGLVLKELPDKLFFDSRIRHYRVMEIVETITRFFGIECNEAQLAAMKVRFERDQGPQTTFADYLTFNFPELDFDDLRTRLSPDDTRFLEEIGTNYDAAASKPATTVIEWPRRSFLEGELPGRHLTGPHMLEGPARILFYGPYYHLPKGRWHCEVDLELKDCQSDTICLLDINQYKVLNAVSMRLQRRGRYAIDIQFDNEAPQNPIEIRLYVQKGATEGEILLHAVRMHPLNGSIPAETAMLTESKDGTNNA